MQTATRTTRIPQLDGLRAVAIALVVLGHSAIPLHNRFIGAAGSLGVDVFFVLSGYLITSLLLAERERSGTIDLLAFYVRRTRRIFPAYYVFLASMGVLALLGLITVSRADFVTAALYVRNYHIDASWWLGHSWSLCVEEQFYLLWPALLLLVGNTRARVIALWIIGLSPLVRVGFYIEFPHLRELISITTPTRLDLLMFGCVLAILSVQSPAMVAAFATRFRPSYALIAILLSLLLTARFKGAFEFTAGYTIFGLGCAAILLDLLQNPGSAAARVLSNPCVVWIGRISYSLYLWQQLFLTPSNPTVLGIFPINVLAAVGMACASFYLVEMRFFKPIPVRTRVRGESNSPIVRASD